MKKISDTLLEKLDLSNEPNILGNGYSFVLSKLLQSLEQQKEKLIERLCMHGLINGDFVRGQLKQVIETINDIKSL